MFLLYGLLAGLVAGWAMGGRLERLGTLDLHWRWLALGGLAVQVALFWPGIGDQLGGLAPIVYVLSTLAVAVFVLRNIALPGLPLVALGATCNLAAIVANGGYMPASPSALAAIGKSLGDAYSNSRLVGEPALAPLTDIFYLPRPIPFANVFSVGDVLIALGVAITVAASMRISAASDAAHGREAAA